MAVSLNQRAEPTPIYQTTYGRPHEAALRTEMAARNVGTVWEQTRPNTG
jgi:hypothetical protein